MNVILILIDSCNRHYLSPYGCKTVRTPNMQQLADRGVTFTNHVIGSAPCMPARRELMTGRREFLFRGWGHMEPFDAPLAAECRELGAVTQMVTDHYHYWEQGAQGYIEHFDGCEMIRGHELDYWKTALQPDEPDWVRAINAHRPGWGSRYYRNVAHFKSEEDFFSPTVFRKAAEWLEANHDRHVGGGCHVGGGHHVPPNVGPNVPASSCRSRASTRTSHSTCRSHTGRCTPTI